MTFEFENDAYRYEFTPENTADGPYLIVLTSYKDRPHSSACTGFKIVEGKVVWQEFNVGALHLTPEAMKYVDRIMRLRAFW